MDSQYLDVKIKKEIKEEVDSNDEEEESEDDENVKHRARLYKLDTDNKWSEIGIGQVSTCYVQQLNSVFVMVNSETDSAPLLLCKVRPDTCYSKQQGRFISWTEDDAVLGLSFEDYTGCAEIWGAICQVQGQNPAVECTQESTDEEEEEEEEEVEDTKANIVNKERWFEEMLDFDQVELSSFERDAVEQLIEGLNRKVGEDIEPTEGLKELHKNLMYLLKR